MNGTPLQVVARNLGHVDTRMVEKHYGHLSTSFVADPIRVHAPLFGAEKIEIGEHSELGFSARRGATFHRGKLEIETDRLEMIAWVNERLDAEGFEELEAEASKEPGRSNEDDHA